LDIILEEPNADTYLIWGVSDKWSWLGGLNRQKGLIYDDNLKPKPAFDSILVRLQTYEPPKDTSKKDSVATDSTKKDSTVTDSIAKDSTDAIKTFASRSNISAHVVGRTLFVTGTKAAKVNVFDMQGRPIFSTLCKNGAVELTNLAEGLYVVRVQSGFSNITKRISIK
jgi:endo-1,4-beta-xylanase